MADHAANVSGPPEILHGHFSDGAVLDEIHYLECKIILKPERFSSAQSFQDFGDLVQRAADKFDIERDFKCVAGVRPSLREVMFLDTADFRLYNNSFILFRQRVTYEDHFPVGDPEMVFKFRHPDYRRRPHSTYVRDSPATFGSSSRLRHCRCVIRSAAIGCFIRTMRSSA